MKLYFILCLSLVCKKNKLSRNTLRDVVFKAITIIKSLCFIRLVYENATLNSWILSYIMVNGFLDNDKPRMAIWSCRQWTPLAIPTLLHFMKTWKSIRYPLSCLCTRKEYKPITIFSRYQEPCGEYHLHCMEHHRGHDQIKVQSYPTQKHSHDSFSSDSQGNVGLHD